MRSNAGLYNSEYRSFNRGYGRGNYRSFQTSQRQPSPQPTRKGDIFVEAGKLAVEYLVSHGLLSSSVLPGKGQNGTIRNSSREFKDHRSIQDKENPNSPVNGSSRKFSDDHDPSLNRSSSRERRRLGPSRSYSSDWSREVGREGSLSDKVTENDKISKDTTKDGDAADVSNAPSVESDSKVNNDSELQDEMKKCDPDVDSDSMMTPIMQSNEDVNKPSDGLKTGHEETREGSSDAEKETFRDQLDIQHSEEKNDTINKDGMDLLKLCPSADIPTRVGSSLINNNQKTDPFVISEEQNTSVSGHDSFDATKNFAMNDSISVPSSNGISSNCIGSVLAERSLMHAGVSDHVFNVNQQNPSEPLPFTDNTFSYEQKPGELSELGRCGSIPKDRGEKRAHEEEHIGEGSKKAKQWLSVAQSDEYSQLSDLGGKQSNMPAMRADGVNFLNGCANQENFANVSSALTGGVDSGIEQGERKQLFSSSFKICDLNLMEASDMHDNHDVSSLLYPSMSAPSKDATIGSDLTMNNICSLNTGYNDCGSARKGIEIIDLDSESLQEGKNMPTRSMEADITSMGNFPNNPQNPNDNPDGQDGYGFMISELLGNDVPNCSSVQPDINSLHNDMGLHHGQGMFNEDDPIYMSLGEIPISLLRVWEQPAQERNPFEL